MGVNKVEGLITDGKSSQENIKDTHERVKLQVEAELSKLTDDVSKNFYRINENGVVEYNMSLVKQYLEIKKDKQYSELQSKNTAAWIMAVQIALCSVGYDTVKVDGILRSRGALTSNTIKAIKQFQEDNGLTPDGKPGSKTIKKLLEKLYELPSNPSTTDQVREETTDQVREEAADQVREETADQVREETTDEVREETTDQVREETADQVREEITDQVMDQQMVEIQEHENLITKDQFDVLCSKTKLSDKEMEQVVTYANEKCGGRLLLLNMRTIMNKNQLNELGKVKVRLAIPGINSLTDDQVKGLCSVEQLVLSGLRKITPSQARILGKSNVKVLYLDGLNYIDRNYHTITDDIARELAKIPRVCIYGLTENQKKIMGNSLDGN